MDAASSEQSSLLSKRAQVVAKPNEDAPLWEILEDLWDPEHNPEGFVSVGIAENRLMHAELQERMDKASQVGVSAFAFTYGDGPLGTTRLRKTVARFLNRHLKPVVPLKWSHVAITNGVSSAIEHCAWAFADQGDAILLGQPYYVAFIPDMEMRLNAQVLRVKFGQIDPTSIEAVKKYEDAIIAARGRGVTVKALMLCSPHNPLGRCYPREVIIEYLKLCQKYQIHFISDEIYALSIWKNKEDTSPPPVEFTSVLSIDTTDLINPSLVHVLWGLSKDFGANGVRVGCFISQSNRPLFQALKAVGLYSYASQVIENVTAEILSDDTWTDNYIKTNQERLSDAYSYIVNFLREHNISYSPGANAAFFIWVDLGKAYLKKHPERRRRRNNDNDIDKDGHGGTGGAGGDLTSEILTVLLKHKVYIAGGVAFGAETQGLFRIVFSHPRDYLAEGLKRMVRAIEVGDPDGYVNGLPKQKLTFRSRL